MLALKETESIIEYLNVQTAMQGMRKIIQEYFFISYFVSRNTGLL
jgi:hypothetical protein